MSQRLRAKYNRLVLKSEGDDELIDESIGGVDDLLPIIDRLRERGFVILLKWDGGRNSNASGPYDFLVQRAVGSAMHDSVSVRINDRNLESAVLRGLIEVRRAIESF